MLSMMEAVRSDKDVLLASYAEQNRKKVELEKEFSRAKNLLDEAERVMAILHPHSEWRKSYRSFHRECAV
jgi:hypothetical protein